MNSQIQGTDLTNCDREEIQHVSYVQNHGVFFAFSPRDLRVQHVSQNITKFFPEIKEIQAAIGRKLSDLFPGELIQSLQGIIKSNALLKTRTTRFTTGQDKPMDVFVFQMEDYLVGVELEMIPEEISAELKNSGGALRDALLKMKTAKTVEELGKIACHSVRMLTGFERVMLYRFFPPTMYGEVIAEDKIAEAKTFNHHRFPATDIPKPARDLYLRNQIRYIHNSHDDITEVYPKVSATTGKSLDFSDSRLRGVSLIHLEYLRNMDVGGSFSVAVVVDNKLWGLIACHHSKTKYIPHVLRENAEIVAQMLALSAPVLESKNLFEKEVLFQERLHSIFTKLKISTNPVDLMFREVEKMNDIFNSGGFALVSSTRIDFGGMTPRREDLMSIWSFVREWMDQNKKDFFVTASLSSLDAKFESIKELSSGVMAFSLSEFDDSLFMIFRPEFLQNILWGGDPRKNFEERNYKGTINPRLSFDTWSEVIKGSSLPWERFEVEGLKNFKSLVFDSLVRKDDLIRELSLKLKLIDHT